MYVHTLYICIYTHIYKVYEIFLSKFWDKLDDLYLCNCNISSHIHSETKQVMAIIISIFLQCLKV